MFNHLFFKAVNRLIHTPLLRRYYGAYSDLFENNQWVRVGGVTIHQSDSEQYDNEDAHITLEMRCGKFMFEAMYRASRGEEMLLNGELGITIKNLERPLPASAWIDEIPF